MSRQKVHTAVEADWSFFGDEVAVRHVYGAARRLSEQYGLEVEDCQQDALLWCSVRPGLVNGHIETGDYRQLGQDCYANMSQVRSTQFRNSIKTVSYEEEFLDGEA